MVDKKPCKKCNQDIFIVPRFKGLYCYDYCCRCCPDSKTFPCQKEKIEGTCIENLAKTQLNKEVD